MTVIDHLDAEWPALARSAPAVRALAAWATAEPALCFPSLPALQAHVERRDLAPVAADTVLAALARRAPADPWAARVLLQLLLPGCKALVRRYGAAERDEMAGFVVAAAWDRIRTYPVARRPHRIAANVLLDVRQRLLRSFAAVPEQVSLDDLPPSALPLAAAPDEAAGGSTLLAWAVRHGHLDRDSAHLIALTRLEGVRVSDLARDRGANPQTLRRQRLRAEARLRRVLAA